MNAAPSPHRSPPGAGARRARFAGWSLVLIVGMAVVVVLANMLTARYAPRFDVTQTGDQNLAPRTMNILRGLRGEHRILVAAPLRTLDRSSVTRLRDTLNDFSRASPNLTATMVDTGSLAGRDEFVQLVRSLVSREGARLGEQRERVEKGISAVNDLSAFLGGELSSALLAARELIPSSDVALGSAREFLEQTAAAARVSARDLEAATAKAAQALATGVEDVRLPSTDEAARTVARVLMPASEQLAALGKRLKDGLATRDAYGAATAQIRTLLGQVTARQEAAALAGDEMARLPRLDIHRITGALQGGSVALVIGPSGQGVTAVDMDSLFPAASTLAQPSLANLDLGRRAEDLFSVALSSLTGPARPIVVIVHGEVNRVLESTPVLDQLTRRLLSRGIDVVEWASVLDPDPAGLARLNPDNSRPVVYVCVAPNTAAGEDPRTKFTGVQRAQKLGVAIRKLDEDRRAMLLCLYPSVMPTYGDPDPLCAPLARYGLIAYTGRTLLRELIRPQGRQVEVEHLLQPTGQTHPIARAVRGLPLVLAWPVDIGRTSDLAPQGVSVWPILTLDPADSIWSESQWLKFWSVPEQTRRLLPDAPAIDKERDLVRPDIKDGQSLRPWTLGVAAQRKDDLGVQRLVVMGANGWFVDRYAFQTDIIDGREMLVTPGNIELFEACVSWLAGQDDMIAQSPTARVLPVVKPIEARTLMLLRAGFILGLPLLALVMGVIYRLVRG